MSNDDDLASSPSNKVDDEKLTVDAKVDDEQDGKRLTRKMNWIDRFLLL